MPPVRRAPASTIVRSFCGLVLCLQLGCAPGQPPGGTDTPPSAVCPAPVSLVDVSTSANVVGTGTAASCTEAALDDALGRGGPVRFDCGRAPVVIALTREHPIARDTVLDGAGLVTFDGGGRTRMFSVALGVGLTLERLTFRNARTDEEGSVVWAPFKDVALSVIDCVFEDNTCANTGQDIGGALATYEAELVISGSVFNGNRGSNGGAIRVISSNLTVVNSRFSGNVATGTGGNGSGGQGGIGGAIYVDAVSDQHASPLTVCGAVFEGNQAGNQGGAVFIFLHPGQSASVASSSLLSNAITGPEGLGGGLYVQGGPLAVTGSTLSANVSTLHAGGVFLGSDTPASFTNCTIEGNSASATGGNAGGLWTGDAAVSVTSCTIANNRAHYGPGLFAGSATTLTGSLLANNGGNEFGGMACADSVLDGGGNVQFPATNARGDDDVACTGSVVFGDPKLAALADNGGPTRTMALQTGSAAEGAAGGHCPATDQRGTSRSAPCDSGAFEL